MLKGLLLRVWHWWMRVMFLMTLSSVILFNVVATLVGGADIALTVGAINLGAGGSSGARCHAMMAVSF
jgi:hypothetical protein